MYTNLRFVIIWLYFDFSDCLLLAKSLIIWRSEILSDLGFMIVKMGKYLTHFSNAQYLVGQVTEAPENGGDYD